MKTLGKKIDIFVDVFFFNYYISSTIFHSYANYFEESASVSSYVGYQNFRQPACCILPFRGNPFKTSFNVANIYCSCFFHFLRSEQTWEPEKSHLKWMNQQCTTVKEATWNYISTRMEKSDNDWQKKNAKKKNNQHLKYTFLKSP